MNNKDTHSVGTWINPYRLNYGSPYPVGVSIRDYFSKYVVTCVDIGIYELTRPSPEQAAFDPSARIILVLADCFQVEERALAGVGFFGQDDVDAYKRGFVGQHLDELRMGNVHEVLV